MSSKYHGLPDIDTAPDVFETIDEPEIILRPNDNGLGDDEATVKFTSEAIDGSTLPSRRKAERVFGSGTKRRDTSDLTFRPRLPPLRRHRSSSSSSDDSPVPRETPAARIRRLKAELAEVEAEVAASSSSSSIPPLSPRHDGEAKRKSVLPHRQPVDLVGELSRLRERIDAVDIEGTAARDVNWVEGSDVWKERLSRLTESSGDGATENVEDGGHAGLTVGEGHAGLSELDKRLAMLENLVGTSDSSMETASSPLVTTLSKLDHLLALLTQPRHLDAISRRVKLLLVDLDRAAAAARRQGPSSTITQPPSGDKSSVSVSSTDYTSLQSLFSLLPRLDPLIPILPPLLARLRSLAGLHAAADQVADGLARLQDTEKKDAEEVKELLGVVENVQKGLDGAGGSIVKNWEALEVRMRDLEERLKKLDQA